MTKDSVLLKPAFIEACKQITDFVTHGVLDSEKDKIKIIMSTLGAYTRLRAVEAHESGLTFAVARTMANNTKELKGYVRKSLTEYIK